MHKHSWKLWSMRRTKLTWRCSCKTETSREMTPKEVAVWKAHSKKEDVQTKQMHEVGWKLQRLLDRDKEGLLGIKAMDAVECIKSPKLEIVGIDDSYHSGSDLAT